MSIDGSDVRQLTRRDDQEENYSPSWSPNGTRLCLASRREGYSSLRLMHSDASEHEPLTTVERVDDDFPAWSPDGRAIAFSRCNRRGPEDLWVIDLATRRERPLAAHGLMDYSPSWSPDGRLVAFRRSFGRPPGVYIAPVSGGEPWSLTPGHSPSWHPTGGTIAYSDEGCICTIGLDSDGQRDGSPTRLTGGHGFADDSPCWSPDGAWLAFEREVTSPDGDVSHILIVRADEHEEQNLGEGQMPAWSPPLPE